MADQNLGTLTVTLQGVTKGLDASLKRANDGMKSFVSNLPSAAVLSAPFAALGAGVVTVSKFANAATLAQIKLQTAIKGTSEAIDIERINQLAGSLQSISGISDDATKSSAAFLVNLGLQQGQIEGLLPLIQDLAKASGVNLGVATRGVVAAFDGSAEALRRYGVVLNDTEKDILRTGTQTQKFAVLTAALEGNVGGVASALGNTAVGGFDKVSEAIGDTLEQLGFLIDLPIGGALSSIADSILSVVDTVQNLDDGIKQWLVRGGAFLGALTGLTAAVGSFILVGGPLLTIITAMATPLLLAAAAIGAVVAGFAVWRRISIGLGEALSELIDNVLFEFDEFAKKIKDTIDQFREFLKIAKAFAFGESEEQAFAGVQEVREAPIAGQDMIGTSAESITAIATNAFDTIADGLGNTADFIGKEFDALLSSFGIDIDKAGKRVENLGKASDKVSKKIPKLVSVADFGKKITDSFKNVADSFEQAAQETERKASQVPDFFADAASAISAKIGNQFKGALQSVGDSLSSAVQLAGSIIGSAVAQGGENISAALQGAAQGFQVGGIFGAIIGALLALLTQTESFAALLQIGDESLGVVVRVLNRFLKPFIPLIKALTSLGELFLLMSMETVGFGTVVEVLTKVLGVVAQAINFIAANILKLWNRILSQFAKLADKIGLGDLADRIRKSKIAQEDLTEFLAEAAVDMPRDFQKVGDRVGDSFGGASSSMDDFSDSVDNATEKLTNVPRGFKLAMRRFESVVPGAGALAPGESADAGTKIETMNVMLPATTEEFLELLRSKEDLIKALKTGSTATSGGPFSVVRQGA